MDITLSTPGEIAAYCKLSSNPNTVAKSKWSINTYTKSKWAKAHNTLAPNNTA